MERRVGIIGAGISGLLACKYVLETGFRPIVFEAKNSIGGVWTQTMGITKLQNQKQDYQFSDFAWPSSVKDDFPNQEQILDYINSYAHHFDLFRYIKFGYNVISINYDEETTNEETTVSWEPLGSKGKWEITVEDRKIYEVDFLILCLGKVSGLPNIPQFPLNKGPEAFKGKVVHSMDYSAMDNTTASEFIRGQRVTVVGLQKSALDAAIECATTNGVELPCTVIYRSVHWNIPHLSVWGVPLSLLYFNRFAELMIHKPNEGLILSLLASILLPLRWLISKFVESYIKWKLPLKKYQMIPKHSFNEDFSSCALARTGTFYDKVEEGSILLRKSTAFSFCRDGVIIDNNNAPLETDIVILATGYKGSQKLKNIFAATKFQKYTENKVLYRGCINPRIQKLAIVGYSESILFLHTAEMTCRWIAHLLKGTFKLPRIKTMEEDALKWENYWKKYGGENYLRSQCMNALLIWYNDQLCRDIGCKVRRKKGIFAELFEPYGTDDYVSLSPQ